MQNLTWGWALRIVWGAFWRWVLACIVAVLAIATVVVLIHRTTGQPSQIHNPAVTQLTGILWLLALGWAIGAALRARHGGYRLVLVSDQVNVTPPG